MGAETKLIPSLSSSLVKALAEIGGAAKDKVNPHFKSKYADLASVVDAVKPILAKHGLAFTQGTEPSEGGVIVETFVWSADGEPHSLGKLYVPANKQDAQGFGSALTYARRYSLMTAFGVPAEDDDGNAAVKAGPEPRAATGFINDDQWATLSQLMRAAGVTPDRVAKRFDVKDVAQLPAARFEEAKAALTEKIKQLEPAK